MNKQRCPECNGLGATYEQARVGQFATPFVCTRCDGDGEVGPAPNTEKENER